MKHIISQGEDCAQFFSDYITMDRKVLCIATLGFSDICLHFPLALARFSQVDFLFLVEERPEVSDILRAAAARNKDVLINALTQRKVTFETIEIVTPEDTANVAGRRAAQVCRRVLQQSYTDVFIDASAMSRGVCFPMVKYAFEQSKKPGQARAHLMTAGRNRSTIEAQSTSSDSPQFVHGFHGVMDTYQMDRAIKLWIPQLSENAVASLSRIQHKIAPDETCPILPFPSWDPRRSDRLLKKFQGHFLDDWNVNLLDVIYAHESNPMDVCTTIMRIHRNRTDALSASCTAPSVTVLSPSGSRIGSVGMLLAAIELELPIMYEESIGYYSEMSSVPDLLQNMPEHLWHIWLRP